MPAIIDNQPLSYWCGDGAKSIAESQKNERNRMNLIRKAETPGVKPRTDGHSPEFIEGKIKNQSNNLQISKKN